MDCKKCERLIQLHIDNCLPRAMQSELTAHLAVCPACSALYVELKQLDILLQDSVTAVDPPADFSRSVMAALPDLYAKPQAAVKRRRRVIWSAGLAAVAAALLLVAGLSGWFASGDPGADVVTPPVADIDLPDDNTTLPQLPDLGPEVDNGNESDNDHGVAVPDGEDVVVAETDDESTTAQPGGNSTGAATGGETTGDETYSSGIDLPPVATNSVASGAYSLITLASYADYDITLTSVRDGAATYFIKKDGVYLEYQVATEGGEPQFIGEAVAVPAGGGFGQYVEDETGDYYAASSVDGVHAALSCADGVYLKNDGEEAELILAMAGGSLLAWSDDCNKVLFTDSGNNLWVYYVQENLIFALMSGVRNVCWGGNQNVVAAAYDSATGHYSVFRVTVP